MSPRAGIINFLLITIYVLGCAQARLFLYWPFVIQKAKYELSGIHRMDYRLRGNDEYKLIHTFTRHTRNEERVIWFHHMDYRLRGNDVGIIQKLWQPHPSYQKRGTSYLVSTAMSYPLYCDDTNKITDPTNLWLSRS